MDNSKVRHSHTYNCKDTVACIYNYGAAWSHSKKNIYWIVAFNILGVRNDFPCTQLLISKYTSSCSQSLTGRHCKQMWVALPLISALLLYNL